MVFITTLNYARLVVVDGFIVCSVTVDNGVELFDFLGQSFDNPSFLEGAQRFESFGRFPHKYFQNKICKCIILGLLLSEQSFFQCLHAAPQILTFSK